MEPFHDLTEQAVSELKGDNLIAHRRAVVDKLAMEIEARVLLRDPQQHAFGGPGASVSLRNLNLWARTLLEDEYNDTLQSETRGEAGRPSGYTVRANLEALRHLVNPHPLLDVGCGSGQTHADYYLDPNSRQDGDKKVRQGWVENMPFEDGQLGRVVAWGMWCFLRSPIEALMEINRVLRVGGDLVLDVVTSSTMPLCQTVEPNSFLRHLALHGFRIEGVSHFGPEYHRRMGILAVKTTNWDPAKFRMLQATSKPLNWNEYRDWFVWGDKGVDS